MGFNRSLADGWEFAVKQFNDRQTAEHSDLASLGDLLVELFQYLLPPGQL